MSKTLAAVVALGLTGCTAVEGDTLSETAFELKAKKVLQEHPELKPTYKATKKYRDVERALEDGYELGNSSDDFPQTVVNLCVKNPDPNVGAMGFHFFDVAAYEDPAIDLSHPEVLVYESCVDDENDDDQGCFNGYRLVAVEWVVKKETWEAAGNTAPPELSELPHEAHFHILNTMLNWYLLHAWIYKDNPAGIYADFNPTVTCPP
ncbi:MAG: hypothetical protein HOV80_34365 [Polyangiaceae bacterium]|nr:hypothetical protein [Polyangiaceae bacterium]